MSKKICSSVIPSEYSEQRVSPDEILRRLAPQNDIIKAF